MEVYHGFEHHARPCDERDDLGTGQDEVHLLADVWDLAGDWAVGPQTVQAGGQRADLLALRGRVALERSGARLQGDNSASAAPEFNCKFVI